MLLTITTIAELPARGSASARAGVAEVPVVASVGASRPADSPPTADSPAAADSTAAGIPLTGTGATGTPATDLGFLLHKNPGRVQAFDLSVGTAHVFYPEATPTRCTAALLLEVDPVGLVRGRRGPHGGEGFSLARGRRAAGWRACDKPDRVGRTRHRRA